MKYFTFLFFLLFSLRSYSLELPKSTLCQKAFINSLIVSETGADLCELSEANTPIKARSFLAKVIEANHKIIKSLNLPVKNPFLGRLRLVLKASQQGIIDSAFEIERDHPTLRLGTRTENYFENFSDIIYTHEMGHWYVSYYLNEAEGITRLNNIPTFQEFFADALVVDIYGGLSFSDIDAPDCIKQIRSVGPDITFDRAISDFDYSSYFRNSNKCCFDLAQTGQETEYSKTICKENKDIEGFLFPNGLPIFSNAPLKYNVHSFNLSAKLNNGNGLEPHRASAPMNSFLLELSQKTKRPVMKLILPALRKVVHEKITYKCGHEDLMRQGAVYELNQNTDFFALDYLFLEIKKQLQFPGEFTIFDKLFKKYSMQTAQVIFRNEIVDLAKFAIQIKLKDQLNQAWKEKKYFLNQWHCIDQLTGEQSLACSFDVVCKPEDQQYQLKREFLKRDQDKSIYTPVAKFINEETQKEVIFVGLNHTGPRHYFENIEKYLKSKFASDENVILREFFTCSDRPVLTSDIVNITTDESNALNTYLENLYYPYVFLKLDHASLAPLFKTYQLREDHCILDIDNKTFRPRIVVERNEKSCKKAHANSTECQWETVERLLSTSPNTEEGDLVLSDESQSVQISAINMYKGLPSGGNLDLWARLIFPTQYVLDDYREANLLQKTLASLNSPKKRAILPWGVGHIQALKEQLYKNGFRQYEVFDVPYAHMSDYGEDMDINSMLTTDFDYIGPEYGF